MKDKSAFDAHLTINEGRIPSSVHDAAVFVADTVDIAWLAAQAVFDDRATPELALAMYDRIMSRMGTHSSFDSAQGGQ